MNDPHEQNDTGIGVRDDKAVISNDRLETFWKASYGQSFYIVENLGDIVDEIKEMEPGDFLTVEKVRMSRADFNALPEFTGF